MLARNYLYMDRTAALSRGGENTEIQVAEGNGWYCDTR